MVLMTCSDDDDGVADAGLCLLLVATIIFMDRETRFYIPDNVSELVNDLPSWNTYPWGEYFWRIFYLRTLNVVPRKNERDSKKDKEKVVEPPKKKKKPAKSSKKKNKADEQSPKKMTTYNLYGFVWSLKGCSRLISQWSTPILTFVPSDNEKVLVPDVEQEHNLICSIVDTADETSQLDLKIHFDDHVQDLNSVYQDMDKDSNIHCEDHVEEQNSPFQDMDKESNIHSHDTVEQQNSPNMCKEHVLAEFDAIKATVNIIDKIKGEVSTSCLEKELDIVKDRIAVFEKCFKLRYHDTSEDSIKQVCYKQHDFHCSKSDSAVSDVFHQEVASEKRDWPGEALGFIYAESQDNPIFIYGSVGFNDKLDPGCKDHQLNDNVPNGLVKPVDRMCGEVNKSDDKLDETLDGSFGFDDMLDPGFKDLVKPVDMMCGEDNISEDMLDDTVAGGVIFDRSMIQSSPPPNAMEYQEPEPTDKVNAEVSVYGPMDPGCKDQPLNDNVPKGLVKLDDMMSGEDNISDYNLDETVAGGVIVHRATL
ncbi:hypothetical protein Tco_1326649 [Tanacetum coccineum]